MIVIALGANLPSLFGPPDETLQAAVRALESRNLKIIAQSRIWLTAPVPVSDQPDYHNAVVAVDTDLDAFALLAVLQDIEHEFGRVRTIRNAPRVLDLDLIVYHDEIIGQEPELIVPHPRMHERGFVLLPLRDIAPDWVHPLLREPLANLIDRLAPEQIARPL